MNSIKESMDIEVTFGPLAQFMRDDSVSDNPEDIPEIRWSITSGQALLNCEANLFFLPRAIAK